MLGEDKTNIQLVVLISFEVSLDGMHAGHEADEETLQLFKAAAKAAEGSCCWNSGVSVGCAILTEDGIVTGANAETTALGIGYFVAFLPNKSTFNTSLTVTGKEILK